MRLWKKLFGKEAPSGGDASPRDEPKGQKGDSSDVPEPATGAEDRKYYKSTSDGESTASGDTYAVVLRFSIDSRIMGLSEKTLRSLLRDQSLGDEHPLAFVVRNWFNSVLADLGDRGEFPQDYDCTVFASGGSCLFSYTYPNSMLAEHSPVDIAEYTESRVLYWANRNIDDLVARARLLAETQALQTLLSE